MKAKIILTISLLLFILSEGKPQEHKFVLPAQWKPVFMTVINRDTIILAFNSSQLYSGVPNQMIIITRPKKIIKINFNKGIVNQLKDSLYEVIPNAFGDYKMKINGWQSSGTIVSLPNPEIFYLKGFTYPQPVNELYDLFKGITINDLLRYNKIEARFKDYIYKVKEFQCRVLGIRGESDINSPVFDSDSIDSDFLKSLNIKHHALVLSIENIKLIAPDSTERIIKGYPSGIFLAEIYKDSTEMLMGRYLANHVVSGKTVKSDLRICIEGNPSKEDIQTIRNTIGELNFLLTTIKVKLVKHFPSVVIRFDTTDAVHGKGAKTGVMHSNGSNRFFPLLSNTRIFINTKSTSQKERNLILWKEISRSLCEFENYKADSPIISTIIGENSTPGLTHADKMVLKAIFSPGSDKIIKEVKQEWTVRPKIRILLTILLSFILFLVFYEINNYFNIAENISNSIFRQVVSVLIISQLALASFYLLKFYDEPESAITYSIWQIEIYVCSFAIIAGLFFRGADALSETFKAKWVRLGLNPFLTIISLYLSYQIIYLFVRGEVLRFMTISIDAMTIGLSIVAMRFYLQYEQVRMTSMMQEKEYELTKQKELKNRAELNALHARINPHFLYNALNSIAALARVDSKRTENMALSLSKLFRFTLNREEDMISTIGQEIEMAELYLEIEKHRFTERLTYNISVDDKLKERTVPRLLIQPLVENSIKHGISKITGQGNIEVKVYEQGKALFIEIYDNGPGFPEGLLSGYGLQNTYDKLSLVYKNPYEIKFVNSPEKYIQIKLK